MTSSANWDGRQMDKLVERASEETSQTLARPRLLPLSLHPAVSLPLGRTNMCREFALEQAFSRSGRRASCSSHGLGALTQPRPKAALPRSVQAKELVREVRKRT